MKRVDPGDGDEMDKFENAKTCSDICLFAALNTQQSIGMAVIEDYDCHYHVMADRYKRLARDGLYPGMVGPMPTDINYMKEVDSFATYR